MADFSINMNSVTAHNYKSDFEMTRFFGFAAATPSEVFSLTTLAYESNY